MTDVGGVPVVHTGNGFGDGMGGWMGMLLILALLGGFGRGGLGGCGGAPAAPVQFAESRMESRVDFDFLRSGQFGLQRDILNQGRDMVVGNMGLQRDILLTSKDQQHSMDLGFCRTNHNIDSVKLENERNTSRIVENATANTQRILDRMAADELRQAYAQISRLEQAGSEARIQAGIIAAIQPPRPVPAYAAANPFEAYIPTVQVAPRCHPCHPCGFGAA